MNIDQGIIELRSRLEHRRLDPKSVPRNTAKLYFWLRYEWNCTIRNPLLLPVLWVLSIERPSVSRWGVEAGCTESRNLNHLSVVQTASSCFKTRLCSRICWDQTAAAASNLGLYGGTIRCSITDCVDKEIVTRLQQTGQAEQQVKKDLIKIFYIRTCSVWKHFKNVFKLDSTSCSSSFADFSGCDRVKISISWEQPIQPPLAERVSWIFTEILRLQVQAESAPGLQTCFNVRNTAREILFLIEIWEKTAQ